MRVKTACYSRCIVAGSERSSACELLGRQVGHKLAPVCIHLRQSHINHILPTPHPERRPETHTTSSTVTTAEARLAQTPPTQGTTVGTHACMALKHVQVGSCTRLHSETLARSHGEVTWGGGVPLTACVHSAMHLHPCKPLQSSSATLTAP